MLGCFLGQNPSNAPLQSRHQIQIKDLHEQIQQLAVVVANLDKNVAVGGFCTVVADGSLDKTGSFDVNHLTKLGCLG